ncbi:MAG: hypothetical protein WC856_02130 [Methylococcaceae bacterium]|jgi:hypothetical protein
MRKPIDLSKKYRTHCGYEAEVYAIKGAIVIGAIFDGNEWYPKCFNLNGRYTDEPTYHRYDLIEVSPYEDFKIDDKVLVWNGEYGSRERGYFAGIDENGRPRVWHGGRTWWTSRENTSTYEHCIKA